MKERRVVTSFLAYTEGKEGGQGDKVLILKRSDKVGTYKYHWAAVSGGIETNDSSPLERALKEIQEETSLSSAEITLIRSGKPITILAENIQTIWKVYPFLFHINSLKLLNKIREHQTYKWINPSEITNYECVPNLLETLHRVYLPLCVHKGLNDLFKNRNSGAQELSMEALDILKEAVMSKECRIISKNALDLWRNWLNIGWHLTQIRPNMKASISFRLVSVLERSKQILQERDGIPFENFENIIVDLIDQTKASFKETEKKVNQNFLNALFPSFETKQKIHIMTMSYSSTIYSSLSSFIKKFINHLSSLSKENYNTSSLTITIMESRPLNEGATLAQKLSSLLPSSTKTSSATSNTYNKICIQVITDVSCNYFMSSVTHVLLGADYISGIDGSIINKIGSMSLALSANHFSKPTYIISKSDKIASLSSEEKKEENDSSELTSSYGQDWNNRIKEKNVIARNIYFEMVDSKFIKGYIMEIDGDNSMVDINKIKELWNQRKGSEKIFEELEVQLQ